jgi:hypothetical protein
MRRLPDRINSFMSRLPLKPVSLAIVNLAFFGALAAAQASSLQPDVVIENPVDDTPQLVATTNVPKPHVDAIGQVGSTIFAAGLFDQVVPSSSGLGVPRQNFVAFDANTGALKEATSGYQDPVINGQVWAIATYGNSVYVGGQFTTVNGITRPRLVKINATTGAVDTNFNAGFKGGIVWDLKIWEGPGGSSPMLVVAGSMGKKLMALNLTTGAKLSYFNNLTVADPLPNAWGGVALYNIAISPDGTKLAATGNFQTVAGPFQNRTRFFMADLTGPSASLHPWYYPGFAKPCASTHPRRIAYLQDVDFSPNGSYLVVTATGQIPISKADIWPTGSSTYHTVCDAAGRFDMNDMSKPAWINYTGGDSVWSVAATGAAVYVQGHFQWLDNPNGWASKDGGGAARREGIGAIDPDSGKALPWDPPKPAQIGGKSLLATSAGLWVGSDSLKFNGEPHRGIAFVPLP